MLRTSDTHKSTRKYLFNANILFCLQPFDQMVAIFDILDIFWGILLEGMRDRIKLYVKKVSESNQNNYFNKIDTILWDLVI